MQIYNCNFFFVICQKYPATWVLCVQNGQGSGESNTVKFLLHDFHSANMYSAEKILTVAYITMKSIAEFKNRGSVSKLTLK